MYVIDVILDSFTRLFRSHRYPPIEKLYSIILFIAGLSLRDVSEKLCLTYASRDSVRIWAHRFSSLFKPSRKVRRLITVDKTVLKVNGQLYYIWAAIDVDTNEILAVHASRGIPNTIKSLKKVLDSWDGKPVIVVDREPWYRWALEKLVIKYFHETFGNRNKIERLFRELKDRTKKFCNNINAKTIKCIEEITTAIALIHNIIKVRSGEVILT